MPSISLIGGLSTTRSIATASVDTNKVVTSLLVTSKATTTIIGNITQYWTTPIVAVTKDTIDLTITQLPVLDIPNMAVEIDYSLPVSTISPNFATVDSNLVSTSIKQIAEKSTVDLSKYNLAPDLSALTRLSTFVASGADPVSTSVSTQSWYMG